MARPLNALAFALIVALTGLLTWRISRSWLWSAAASMATLFSANLILVSSMVWSDSWGTVFMVGCLLLLLAYTRTARLSLLVAAALVAGAAMMTRFGAVSLIPVGVAAVLAARPRPRRAVHAGAFAVVALLPIAAWSIRDLLQPGGASRSLGWHPPPGSDLTSAAQTLFGYLSSAPWLSGIILGAVIALAAARLVPRGRPAWRSIDPGTVLVAGAALAYAGVLAVTAFFFDASLSVDLRTLSPLYVLCVVAVASQLGRWSGAWSRRLRGAAWVPVVAVGAISMVWCLQAIPTLRQDFTYTAPAWQRSPLLAAVDRLPRGAVVVTNAPDFVWLRLGRDTIAEPRLVIAKSGAANADYAADMVQVEAAVRRSGGGWLVLWDGDARSYLPDTQQLSAALHLVPFARTDDGEILEIRPG